MIQAVLDIRITFAHIAGVDNQVADAMSRAHLSGRERRAAETITNSHALVMISPCVYALRYVMSIVKSRSGRQLARGPGRGQAEGGKGTRYKAEPPGGDTRAGGLRPEVGTRPGQHDGRGNIAVDRVPGRAWRASGHHTQQAVPRAGSRATGGRQPGRALDLQGDTGHGRYRQAEGHGLTPEGPGASDHIQGSTGMGGGAAGRHGNKSSVTAHVLRNDAPIRGGAPIHGALRPGPTPHKGGHHTHRQASNKNEMGKELTTLQSVTHNDPHADRKSANVPGGSGRPHHGHAPGIVSSRPATDIHIIGTANYNSIPEIYLGPSAQGGGVFPCSIRPPQHKDGISHRGSERGLLRIRGSKTRGLEIGRTQDLYPRKRLKDSTISIERIARVDPTHNL